MRSLIMAVGLAACLGLAGCGGAEEEVAAPPPPRKSMARVAPMYAGQEQILSVQSGSVTPSQAGGVVLKASGMSAGPGWADPAFLPRIYPATPADGIYEVDVIATKPATAAGETPTAIEAEGAWNRYTDGRVKGVKFMTKTNELTVMLPPG